MLATAARTTPTFPIVWAIATPGAVLIFLHANKRGSRHATAWGVSVFFALGLAVPIYLLHGRLHKPSGRRY
jgi:acetyl-CoA carboxylase alpha subunit